MLSMILASAMAVMASGETAAASEVKVKPERRICRTIENTATRMGARRICKTATEWNKDKEEAEGFLTQRQNQNLETQTLNTPQSPN